MATLTLPTDTVLIDSDLYTFLENVKTNVDAMYASGPVAIPDATPYTVLAANSRRLHVVPNATSSITINLPTAAAGLRYEFLWNLAAADAQNTVIVAGAGAFFKGGVVFMDQDGDVMAPVYANGSSHVTLTIVTPEVGTRITVESDGTYWYLNGNVFSATTPTIA